jgi:hypothetical protein
MFSLRRIKQTGSLPVRDRSRRVGYWSNDAARSACLLSRNFLMNTVKAKYSGNFNVLP